MKSNNLKYTITKENIICYGEKADIIVDIRLNDECNNGHQDFAITASIYQAGKRGNRAYISGGCCHEEILKAFPEFKIFVDLHLCDYMGNPMYPVANGFYHLVNGLGNTPPDSVNFEKEYCEYYRITPKQFEVLRQSKNKIQFYLHLQELKIPKQWKKDADKAIKTLEGLTGQQFVNDSRRTQMDAPTDTECLQYVNRQANGYYSEEATQKRKEEEKNNIIKEFEQQRQSELKKINEEYDIKKQVLIIGGKKALANCIYYTHTRQLAFNWSGIDKLSDYLVNKIISEIKLPKGVTIENKMQYAR